MIPYIDLPFVWGVSTLRLLWAVGVIAGHLIFLYRIRRATAVPQGLAAEFGLALLLGALAAGVLGGGKSWIAILGGTALATALLVIRRSLRHWLDLANAAAYALPFGWIFLRLGCVVEHAHGGRLSDSWLAVRYPGGSRWDTAALEALWAVAMAVVFLVAPRIPAAPTILLSLGLFRTGLNVLRIPTVIDWWSPGVMVASGFFVIAVTRFTRVQKSFNHPQ